MAELRRWLLGPEGTRSRARGLARRLEDLCSPPMSRKKPKLDAALTAAHALPAPLFAARFTPNDTLAEPGAEPGAQKNPAEAFLQALRLQARARATEPSLSSAMPVEVDLSSGGGSCSGNRRETRARALERLRHAAGRDSRTLSRPAGDRGKGSGRADPPTPGRCRPIVEAPGHRPACRLASDAGFSLPADQCAPWRSPVPMSSSCAWTAMPTATRMWRFSRICWTRRRLSLRPSPAPPMAC